MVPSLCLLVEEEEEEEEEDLTVVVPIYVYVCVCVCVKFVAKCNSRKVPLSIESCIKIHYEELLHYKLFELKLYLILYLYILYWRVIRVYIDVGFIVDFVDGRKRFF